MPRFWWVNHKQTWRQERAGGYLWAPKRKANNQKHKPYDWMRDVRPGDIIFCYANAAVNAIAVAKSAGYDCPKPEEFGNAGSNWSIFGWRIDVEYKTNFSAIRTADNIGSLRELLPDKFSPIKSRDGYGNQGVYLASISRALAERLAGLTDRWVLDLVRGNYMLDIETPDELWVGQAEWEVHLERIIEEDPNIQSTEKEALVKARIGQGEFRRRLLEKDFKHVCLITGVSKKEHLVAGHIKPWRHSNNVERLDPENGFLLTPSIDHLFDKGYISFENDGRIIPAKAADVRSLERMGVLLDGELRVRSFSTGEREYLDYHRENILLSSRV